VALAVPATLDLERALRELPPAPGCRIVAVLGYSRRRADRLHPIGAARLERAAQEADGAHAVVLSGWARRRGGRSEAELMLEAWSRSPGGHLVVSDSLARTTAENAVHVAALARRLEAEEVVVVTSRWHAARTRAFFRRLLRGSDVQVRIVYPDERRSMLFAARELVRWPLVPLQARRARQRSSSRGP
jgi:uncharacterized SAM-binding protein YcdF (DUF218 family)